MWYIFYSKREWTRKWIMNGMNPQARSTPENDGRTDDVAVTRGDG